MFRVRGASWFLGVSEWIFDALLFLGIWDKRLGILGALARLHVHRHRDHHPVHAERMGPAAGFPAMVGNVPVLMKDVVLLAVSVYLLKQDLTRVLASKKVT